MLRCQSVEGATKDVFGLFVVRDDDDVTHVGRGEPEGAGLVLAKRPVSFARLGCQPLAAKREDKRGKHANHEIGDDHGRHEEPDAWRQKCAQERHNDGSPREHARKGVPEITARSIRDVDVVRHILSLQ